MRFLRRIFTIKEVPSVSWSSDFPLNTKPRSYTVIMLITGLFFFGLGEAIIIGSGSGVSPWTVFAQGFSKVTDWSIGFSTFTISFFVLLLWIPLRQKPGAGTVLNIIIISLVLDLSAPYLPVFDDPALQIAEAAFGVVITGIGGGIYLIANLGPGPRDGLMTGVQRKTGLPLATVRSIIEVSVVVIGWSLGGVVGLGTLLFAFGIGPCVATSMSFLKLCFSGRSNHNAIQ